MLMFLFSSIICLSLGAWFVVDHLHIIRIRQALIVCNRITGEPRRIIVGPRVAMIWPSEDTLLSLDLTMRTVYLSADDIVTTDLAVAASLNIFYAFDPVLFQAAKLDEILPVLTEIEGTIRSCADYLLRSLATRCTTADLLTVPISQNRLGRQLHHTLQSQTQQFGVRIFEVRLLYRPAPMILEAQLIAKRKQLEAESRAYALKVLTTVLNSDHKVMQEILPLELLQRMQQDNTASALNLSLPLVSEVNRQDPLTMQWMLASR